MKVYSLDVTNVNQAFTEMFWKIRAMGLRENSRNGPVLVMPGPVATTFLFPTERVLFNGRRDCNAVFHLIETLWMFAGRNDVASLLPYNSKYGQFAEDDGTVHGAYGFRWRNHFGIDQIQRAIDILIADPESRQVVIEMWDAQNDLGVKVKDKPCNTHIYFGIREGALDMTVCNRSNDMLWGAYGANVVHMSMLQELIAWGVGVPVGKYVQFSNNFHLYTDNEMVKSFLANPPDEGEDHYSPHGPVWPTPMFQKGETVADFLHDCEVFFNDTHHVRYKTNFVSAIAEPIAAAYGARQAGLDDWQFILEEVPNQCDWKQAFLEWAARRDNVKSK